VVSGNDMIEVKTYVTRDSVRTEIIHWLDSN
jgi:hypothetical protein